VEGQDVLLFIDNIFRFTQAGSEVSALLGRMPSAVGYQPTLATDLGELQERITSPTRGRSRPSSASTSRRRPDRPAPATTFAHLDGTVSSPGDRGTRHLPRRRSLDSTSRILDPVVLGRNITRWRARSR